MAIERKRMGSAEPIGILREVVLCALCGSDDSALLFEVKGRGVYVDGVLRPVIGEERIVRCQGCGLVYVNPRLVLTPDIRTYSPEEEKAYFEATRPERQAGNVHLLQRIEERLGGPGRLLDVGCGDGLLLAQAQCRGWECWGLETSGELVSRIRTEHGLTRIFHGTLPSAEYPSGHFDAVLLINVIEHLHAPKEVLVEVARITRSGGLIAVHTPNVKGLSARLAGPSWHHYEPYDHLYYFSSETLSEMLRQAGFTVTGSFALCGGAKLKCWLLSATHRLGLRLDNGLGLLARRPSVK